MNIDASLTPVELLDALIQGEETYRAGTPVMSDTEFDSLIAQAHQIVEPSPELAAFLGSVAGGLLNGDIVHAAPMLSLDKITDQSALVKFLGKLGDSEVLVTPKLDGIAMAVRYRNGVLADLVTRGTGTEGLSVFQNRDLIAGLPSTIANTSLLEVRGEVVMTDQDLATASKNRGEPFANRRNPIGPVLGQNREDRKYFCPMRFVAVGVPASANNLSEDLNHLINLGFNTVTSDPVLAELSTVIPSGDSGSVRTAVETIGVSATNPEFEFLLDGAVIAVNDPAVRKQLGETGHYPRWSTAFKFPSETKQAVIERFDIAVGKTGALSFTAVFADPVRLLGTNVGRAGVHNPAKIAELDLRVGDTVTVTKANDIIPQVLGVDQSKRPGNSIAFQAPAVCPDCGQGLNVDAVIPKCVNKDCSLLSRLVAASSKTGFDWDRIGESVLSKATDAGLVVNLADVFALTEQDWAALDGIDNSAATIEETIARSLATTRLDRVLGALSVRHVRSTFAKVLASHFGTLQAVRDASLQEIMDAPGMTDGRAKDIFDGLHTPAMEANLDQLVALGLIPLPYQSSQPSSEGPFAGAKVLVTGTVEGLNRAECKERVERLGGTPASGVSARVNIFVVGENAGPGKVTKIRALQGTDPAVQVLTATEFLALN